MDGPLVSIIIPCFNAERTVGEAIRSALEQTYSHREVIVVDDGSTDDSPEVLRSFGDRIRVHSGPNAGGSAARNAGAELARGELLQFLDADDLLLPHKLERQVPAAVRHRPDLVFCDAEVRDAATGRSLGTWGRTSVSADDAVVYVLSSVLQTAAPLHWRETFNSVGGFRPELPRCQDPDLHLRLACAGVRFHHLTETLYVVRRTAGSVSNRRLGEIPRWEQRIGLDALRSLQTQGEIGPERRAAFAGFFAAVGRRALRHWQRRLAEECFQLAAELHPDGGLPQAYSPASRRLAALLGPLWAEQVVALKRRLTGIGEGA